MAIGPHGPAARRRRAIYKHARFVSYSRSGDASCEAMVLSMIATLCEYRLHIEEPVL